MSVTAFSLSATGAVCRLMRLTSVGYSVFIVSAITGFIVSDTRATLLSALCASITLKLEPVVRER